MLLRNQNGEIVNHEAVSTKTGYGVIHKQSLPPGSYQLIVINFGESEKDQEFTVTTYAENKVDILEQKEYLEKKISQAQVLTPQDVITTKISNRKNNEHVIGQSFLDETTQTLYLGITKKQQNRVKDGQSLNQIGSEPVTVDIELVTAEINFPFVGVQSSLEDWREGANLNKVVMVDGSNQNQMGNKAQSMS